MDVSFKLDAGLGITNSANICVDNNDIITTLTWDVVAVPMLY